MEAVEEKLARLDESAWKEAGRAKLLLEKTIQEVRRISRNLRPSELDDLGLAPAVRSLCGEFSERTGVATDVSFFRLPRKIAPEIELNLYRIIQEALTNIEKHAQAAHVTVRLSKQRGRLIASVRDDGRGFDPQASTRSAGQPPGMGLVDMRERAAFMGGSCSVLSNNEPGTEILIVVPLVEDHTNKPGICEKK
jgi:two-component system NarL family sensor kinase